MHKRKYAVLAAACLITLVFGAHMARADNRCDIALINTLGEPITAVKIMYDTPYDEQRPSSSEIILPPEGEYRLGIQGVTLPTRIILFLPLSSYEFTDLSGLVPEPSMRLEVAYEDGVPRLKREGDAEKSVSGSEHKYLTPENSPYAVDRDRLTDAVTITNVQDLVAETATDVDPTKTNLDSILFTEHFDEHTTLYFPVSWMDHNGYAGATPLSRDEPDAGIAVIVNIPLPESNIPPVLDDLMSDLRVDGYRPAMFQLRVTGDGDDKEVNFLEGDNDKYDDQDVVQEHLAAALEKGSLLEAEVIWIKTDAFAKAKEDNESPEGPGVRIRVANGQFQAIFMP